MTSTGKTPSRRAMVAIGVLLLWMVGLGFLARREFFRPRMDRLTEAGLRINQYTSFYSLRENNNLIGYASSIVDTTATDITISDFMVRENAIRRPRSSKRAKIHLSRTFRLKDFESSIVTPAMNLKTSGKVEGDSLIFTLSSNDGPPKTSTIRLDGPILLPQLVPLAIALTDDPKVGKKYSFPVFDPASQGVVLVKSTIEKDSMFILSDSAAYDSTAHVWNGVNKVQVKAWLVSSSPGGFNGWLDETGHIVRTTELEADVLRSTIEEAFENWLQALNDRRRTAGLLPEPGAQRPPTRP